MTRSFVQQHFSSAVWFAVHVKAIVPFVSPSVTLHPFFDHFLGLVFAAAVSGHVQACRLLLEAVRGFFFLLGLWPPFQRFDSAHALLQKSAHVIVHGLWSQLILWNPFFAEESVDVCTGPNDFQCIFQWLSPPLWFRWWKGRWKFSIWHDYTAYFHPFCGFPLFVLEQTFFQCDFPYFFFFFCTTDSLIHVFSRPDTMWKASVPDAVSLLGYRWCFCQKSWTRYYFGASFSNASFSFTMLTVLSMYFIDQIFFWSNALLLCR